MNKKSVCDLDNDQFANHLADDDDWTCRYHSKYRVFSLLMNEILSHTHPKYARSQLKYVLRVHFMPKYAFYRHRTMTVEDETQRRRKKLSSYFVLMT